MWVLQIFHDCFDRSQSFAYQWKFKINLSNSPQNNSVEILIRVTLKLQPNFEGIDTSALILKIHEHNIDSAIYLVFGFSQQYFAVISLRSCTSSVNFISNYLLILLENGIPPHPSFHSPITCFQYCLNIVSVYYYCIKKLLQS